MSARKWIIISVINFLFVGIFGLLMRLKFLVPIPWIDQKNIMHAHSHFAFSGWVAQALMIFIMLAVQDRNVKQNLSKSSETLLFLNLISAYGMLISFSIWGYGLYSILFCCLSIAVAFWFCFLIWKDLKSSRIPAPIGILIKVAMIFNMLSALGTFALVYLKITHQLDPLNQLASVYFYLHFQYNGWFFFGSLALLNFWVFQRTGKCLLSKGFAWTYATTVIPAYFLSVLWWKGFPTWLYIVLMLTVTAQVWLWGKLLINLIRLKIKDAKLNLPKVIHVIWMIVALAVCLKLVLQMISIVPSLSTLVYGFRPIVIAYLHLVLLLIISMFLLGYAFQTQALKLKIAVPFGMYTLLFGILLNELLLMLQGIGGLIRYSFHGTHELLALASGLIVCSIAFILWKQFQSTETINNNLK